MYCVIQNNQIIAVHKSKKVVKEYCDLLTKSHPEIQNLYIAKFKKGKVDDKIQRLYLVPYESTYIQEGYLDYVEIVYSSHPYLQMVEKMIDILDERNLSKKERRSIESTIEIIEKIVEDDRSYTPSLGELIQYENQYESYLYGRR